MDRSQPSRFAARQLTSVIIKYPNGATQIIRPNMAIFNGDWQALAQAVANDYLPDERTANDKQKVRYELR